MQETSTYNQIPATEPTSADNRQTNMQPSNTKHNIMEKSTQNKILLEHFNCIINITIWKNSIFCFPNERMHLHTHL
uniref:Uncharacterized protein n=1 Tax=Rhizophora mucronata TaxID=61149 RepID=A0A2P2M517_RHIMU